MNLKFLTLANISVLFVAAIKRLEANGPAFYGWKNDPAYAEDGSIIIDGASATPTAANDRMKEKLNGAYGERFLTTLGFIHALIAKGKKVAILQKAEKGLPFNADGWVILCIEGYPMFHVAPWDLPMGEISELVSLVSEGTEEYSWTEWKGTDKVSEYTMLLNWLTE